MTLPFNFPLGVLACDLEGAHFSQERRLDLSMTIIFKKSRGVESRSVVDPPEAATGGRRRCTL